jgi:hypothetical protein
MDNRQLAAKLASIWCDKIREFHGEPALHLETLESYGKCDVPAWLEVAALACELLCPAAKLEGRREAFAEIAQCLVKMWATCKEGANARNELDSAYAWARDQIAACGPGAKAVDAKAEAKPADKFERLKLDYERHQKERTACPTCGSKEAKAEAQPAEKPAPALAVEPLSEADVLPVVRDYMNPETPEGEDYCKHVTFDFLKILEQVRAKLRPAKLPTVEELVEVIVGAKQEAGALWSWEGIAEAILAHLGAQPSESAPMDRETYHAYTVS